jgi:hypothetical protein
MKSKSKRAPTAAERRHIERLAAMDCVVCGAHRPSEVHEPEQGMWWIAMPLCPACHRGHEGWHGTRLRWRLRKMTELKAINATIESLMTRSNDANLRRGAA